MQLGNPDETACPFATIAGDVAKQAVYSDVFPCGKVLRFNRLAGFQTVPADLGEDIPLEASKRLGAADE
jgi:hypothetical protein